MTTTLITAGGTWSFWDQGFQADVARTLISEWDDVEAEIFGREGPRWRWQPIGYNTSFGPVGGPPDAMSYKESVQTGVAEGSRLIRLTRGRFALSGYSMGSEVVRRLQQALTTGDLRDRQADCIGIATFGDPARQKTDPTFGGGDGWGISKLVIPQGSIPVHTYAIPGDMYCTCPDGPAGDQMDAVYDMLTEFQLHNFMGLMTDFLGSALLQLSFQLMVNPLGNAPAVIESLVRLVQFAATNAHGLYGPWVQHAADWLNSLV